MSFFSSILRLYGGIRNGNVLVLAISVTNSQGEKDGAEFTHGKYDIKGVSASQHFALGT